ncbi:MAG: YihY/virulence factor BrkB family protein [Pseudomonadota bacterium]
MMAKKRQSRVRAWLRIGGQVYASIDERDLGLIAAGVGFYAMLALFPALAATIAVWGLVADPAILERQLDTIAPLMPEQAFAILRRQTEALISANDSALGWTFGVSLAGTLWSARGGMTALIRGLNAVYDRDALDGFLHRTMRALLLTLSLIGMAVAAVLTVLILPPIIALMPFAAATQIVATLLHWAATVFVIVVGLALIYRYGPDRRHGRPQRIRPGVALALAIWGLGSVALTVYFRNFANFNEVYGSLGAVAILLIWFYVSAFAVLLGAQLDESVRSASGSPRTASVRCGSSLRRSGPTCHS